MATTPTEDLRLLRTLLPASILRQVDEVVRSGKGGYETRHEFIADAIETHLLEVKYGATADERAGEEPGGDKILEPVRTPPVATKPTNGAGPRERVTPPDVVPLPEALQDHGEIQQFADVAATTLHDPPYSQLITNGLARPDTDVLFGLHNRDYPSFWAATQLAELTHHELISPQAFFHEATRRAWRFAHALEPLNQQSKVKLTALFPTNLTKPESAAHSFQAFAIGSITRKPFPDGAIRTKGPLFSWGVCQLTRSNSDEILMGLTPLGHQLLQDLAGLQLEWPHRQEQAEIFLGYLRQHAPWDWAGFETALEAIAEGPTPAELKEHFQDWREEWSAAMANSSSVGYTARAREWGLVEPDLINGRYALTEFGLNQRNERSEP